MLLHMAKSTVSCRHEHYVLDRCNGELRLPRFKTPPVLILQ